MSKLNEPYVLSAARQEGIDRALAGKADAQPFWGEGLFSALFSPIEAREERDMERELGYQAAKEMQLQAELLAKELKKLAEANESKSKA